MEALGIALGFVAGFALVAGAAGWWLGRFARLLEAFGELGEREVQEEG